MVGIPRNNRTGALAVYETEPLESKLDIYWETSTSGLINELNTNILENSPEIPVDIYGALGVDVTSVGIGTEETPIASPITKPLVIRNSVGTVLSNADNVYTLLSVRDGYGNDRTNEFALQQGVVLFGATFLHMFKINLSTVQVCNWDHNIRENFTFNINVKVPNSTTAWD